MLLKPVAEGCFSAIAASFNIALKPTRFRYAPAVGLALR